MSACVFRSPLRKACDGHAIRSTFRYCCWGRTGLILPMCSRAAASARDDASWHGVSSLAESLLPQREPETLFTTFYSDEVWWEIGLLSISRSGFAHTISQSFEPEIQTVSDFARTAVIAPSAPSEEAARHTQTRNSTAKDALLLLFLFALLLLVVVVVVVRSVFRISCLFLRPRPWRFEIWDSTDK